MVPMYCDRYKVMSKGWEVAYKNTTRSTRRGLVIFIYIYKFFASSYCCAHWQVDLSKIVETP